MVMVVKANQLPYDLGGHIASFASRATLYEVGFNHFYRGPDAEPILATDLKASSHSWVSKGSRS
jgi:pyruvate dehydrogenase complex dehydrogenase (E1) component